METIQIKVETFKDFGGWFHVGFAGFRETFKWVEPELAVEYTAQLEAESFGQFDGWSALQAQAEEEARKLRKQIRREWADAAMYQDEPMMGLLREYIAERPGLF